MKDMFLFLLVVLLAVSSCTQQSDQNPFFSEWKTPLGTPPFEKINNEHFMPAFEEGMLQQKAEVKAIITNPEPATFENTIEALDYSGDLLTKVSSVFFALNGANTSEEIQKIAKDIAPILSKHNDDIGLNDTLFQRVKAVYEQKDQLGLTVEQATLLDKYYKDFVRGGAKLSEKKKARFREINEELSVLTTKFGENVLKEDNNFELVIDNEADLAGLPEGVIASGAAAAKEKGYEDKWVYTLHKPSWIPFLQYSEKRQLREKIYMAYINRGNNSDEYDNKVIAAKIAALRTERAQLLGFPTHAHFVLDVNMARNPENVYELLDKLWKPALKRAKAELREMQIIADREEKKFRLESWDWWYYAEKLKKEKYAMDDEVLRPYFQLKNVRQGAFDLATKLWGITFHERKDIPVYHEDVKAFEVKEADGTTIGVLYTDYHPRASKRGGAWCGAYRKQIKKDGKNVTPVINNVFNLSKPAADKPALLSLGEVTTIYHEFGHALHGLFSNSSYPRLTGTSLARDFVELPSQIMENWALEPAVLKTYAFHYQTGKPIPDELIEKIKNSSLFNQGFETVEYLAASFLDMDWHTLTTTRTVEDVLEFEDESLGRIGLIPEIVSRYRTPYFRHIFTSGYSAGYYSYIWAEVLDADAFQAFKETDLFNKELAQSYRENILSKGGTEEPMILYKRFRGAEPSIEPLLERRGLK
ncbi:MAG: M3 family metallopeptidase [Candidatus Marinimicrobia bacterium]|nr:M3 family metallopeptidase [Candidatus Neomarinimicrobiota bacterium]